MACLPESLDGPRSTPTLGRELSTVEIGRNRIIHGEVPRITFEEWQASSRPLSDGAGR